MDEKTNKLIFPRTDILKRGLSLLGNNKIKILEGMTKSGKSWILRELYLKIRRDRPQINCLFIQAGDKKMSHITSGIDLEKETDNLGTGLAAIFVDDIQKITDFENAIYHLVFNKNLDIYISFDGNFQLSTSENLLSKLENLYTIIPIHPLPFQELFCDSQEQSWKKVEQHFECGGLPFLNRFSTKDDCKEYLQTVCKTFGVRRPSFDVKKVRNPEILVKVLETVATYTGQPVSAGIIVQSLKNQNLSISIQGAIDYLRFSEQIYVIHRIRCVEFSFKNQTERLLSSGDRYYFEDLGIRASFVTSETNSETRKKLKNGVFLHLINSGWKITTGRTGQSNTNEVDFVCTNEKQQRMYVHCIQEIPEKRFSTKGELDYDAALAPLLAFKDGWRKILITLEPEQIEHRGIECIPYSIFLCS